MLQRTSMSDTQNKLPFILWTINQMENNSQTPMKFKIKLNRFFKQLRACGYIAKQNHPCCQSCGRHAIGDTKEPVVFYHNQDKDTIEDGYVRLAHTNIVNPSNFAPIRDLIKACKDNGLHLSRDWTADERIQIVDLK